MGLDSPNKLVPQMIKRRTPYGLLMSAGSMVKPLSHAELVEERATGVWQHWWQSASSEGFFVYDDLMLTPAELSTAH